jgi:hypothetical protein
VKCGEVGGIKTHAQMFFAANLTEQLESVLGMLTVSSWNGVLPSNEEGEA